MSDPFFILSLPRSRSAWLSAWLSYNGRPCHHDTLGRIESVGELRNYTDLGACGFAETSGSYFPRVLHREFPNAKFLIVRRRPAEVQLSLEALGRRDAAAVVKVTTGALEEAEAYLRSRTEVRAVPFDELNDMTTLQGVWRFLRDDRFPVRHTADMLDLRVTKLRPFAGHWPASMLVEESKLEGVSNA